MYSTQNTTRRVLIVDDEPSLLLSIEAGFDGHEQRFQIMTALNGRDGLNILKAAKIDLIITDLRMPEMDGFDFVRRLSNDYSHIPRIVMSAYCTPGIEKELLEQGVLSFLDKPVDFDTLQSTILNALEPSNGLPPTVH
jgi:DNA-binding NtrC family response regulator